MSTCELLHLVLLRTLVLLLLLLIPRVRAQSTTSQAKSLDVILQQYAYRALVRPKTGTIYNATELLPSNLTTAGVTVAALRLRSGSLRRRGVPMYNEFEIPKGLIVKPYVKRLVLVYQNLGSSTSFYYPLSNNYTYLAPVLGLLAYNGSGLSSDTSSLSPELLDVSASGDPIKVKFRDVKSAPKGTLPKCVWFNLQGGSSNFSNVTAGNTCSTSRQGHFSIVVESTPPPPSPPPPLSPVPSPTAVPPPSPTQGSEKSNNKVWVIVGSVLGGLLFLVLLSLLLLWLIKYRRNKKLQGMERAAEVGETLHMASVRDTKAPAATVTRTQPSLEHEYAP